MVKGVVHLQLRRKRDGEAFLDGYKPALFVEKTSTNLHLLEGYPSYSYMMRGIFYFSKTKKSRGYFYKRLKRLKRILMKNVV